MQFSSTFNELYTKYKRRAGQKGYEFSLTKKIFYSLLKQNCYYCGIEPKQIARANHKFFKPFTYNGIDRKDNDQGYFVGNVVSCCGACNRAKNVMSVSEFYNWVEKIQKNRSKHGRLHKRSTSGT